MRGAKRALLISSAVILLCMLLIGTITVVMFSDTQRVKNHLKAGDMNITLMRTNLTSYSLSQETGMLIEKPANTEIVNFSGSTERNVFDIKKGVTPIVPGSWYEATMQIANDTEGARSDVAFTYWLEIKLDLSELTEAEIKSLVLDEQLKITVTTKEGTPEAATVSQTLDQGWMIGNEETPIGKLDVGESENFKVKMEFLDHGKANNSAMAQRLSFDLIVHAVQYAEVSTTSGE